MNGKEILGIIAAKFEDIKPELSYSNLYELFVAVLLSPQCTDKRVNMITKELFKKYKNFKELADASIDELKDIIKSLGFFNVKAKNLIESSKKIISNFNGNVPDNAEDLMTLDGVGRKVAHVILAEGFNKNVVAVDTHILRVSNRLSLTKSNNPLICEKDLMKIFEEQDYHKMHLSFLLFGRYYCKAMAPKCEECEFADICVYKKR